MTGATGLLGANLIKYLKKNEKDANIIGISKNRLNRNAWKSLGVLYDITWCQGDINDYSFVRSVINEYEIQEIYNLAAVSIVRISQQHPLNTLNTNIIGTANVLEAARENGTVKGIISMSSDKFYGNTKQLPYVEDMNPDPHGVYETSKVCTDVVCKMYGKNFDLPVISVRAANLFGPCDLNLSRLVPSSICKILKNRQPFLWDDVKDYVREFIFVDDMCNILNRLMKVTQTHRGESVNAGSGSIHKVEDFVKRILKVMDKEDLGIQIKKKEIAFKEIPEQYLALNKLKSMIGELPNNTKFDLDGCLRKTVKWYKDYLG